MNIYVANLAAEATDSDLRELFAAFGEVTSSKVIKDHETGYSRGFGFVEMANKSEALKAISELNNAEYNGKYLSVNEAKPRTDRPQGGFGNNRFGGNRGGGGGGGNFKSGGNDRGGYKKW